MLQIIGIDLALDVIAALSLTALSFGALLLTKYAPQLKENPFFLLGMTFLEGVLWFWNWIVGSFRSCLVLAVAGSIALLNSIREVLNENRQKGLV